MFGTTTNMDEKAASEDEGGPEVDWDGVEDGLCEGPEPEVPVKTEVLAHFDEIVVKVFPSLWRLRGRVAVGALAGSDDHCCSVDADLSTAITAPIIFVGPEVDGECDPTGISDRKFQLVFAFLLEYHPPSTIEPDPGRPEVLCGCFANRSVQLLKVHRAQITIFG